MRHSAGRSLAVTAEARRLGALAAGPTLSPPSRRVVRHFDDADAVAGAGAGAGAGAAACADLYGSPYSVRYARALSRDAR